MPGILTRITRHLDDEQLKTLARLLPRILHGLPAERQLSAVQAFGDALAKRPLEVRRELHGLLVSRSSRPLEPVYPFIAGPWVGWLRSSWDAQPAEDREYMLAAAYQVATSPALKATKGHANLIAFLRAHIGEKGTEWSILASLRDRLPVVEWIPLAPESAVNYLAGVHARRGPRAVRDPTTLMVPSISSTGRSRARC